MNITTKGIDVSKWQRDIDWKKVKASGIDFAMVRLGFGSSNGKSCKMDSCFEKNVSNAMAAGVDVGCYFYSYATSADAAKREAEYVVSVLNKYKGVFTYPVAFDLEDKSQVGLGKDVLTNMVIAFGNVIEKAGFYCSLYSNLNWLKNYLHYLPSFKSSFIKFCILRFPLISVIVLKSVKQTSLSPFTPRQYL